MAAIMKLFLDEEEEDGGGGGGWRGEAEVDLKPHPGPGHKSESNTLSWPSRTYKDPGTNFKLVSS